MVLAVVWFAPGIMGPPLGFWIPICCLIATCTGLTNGDPDLKRSIAVSSIAAAIALVAFGAHDFYEYNEMPQAERDKLIPTWEGIAKRKPNAG